MRLILTILLIGLFKADAQMVINASPPYRPLSSPFTGLLDSYSGAAAAYSLRKMDKDYTGNAIRVRRSNDNTEQDIGFLASGELDTNSLKTFVGANSGFITTWYSQGDSTSVNFTQTTAVRQPRIVNSGTIERINNKPSILFTTAASPMLMTVINSASKFAFLHQTGLWSFVWVGAHNSLSNRRVLIDNCDFATNRRGYFLVQNINGGLESYILRALSGTTNSTNITGNNYLKLDTLQIIYNELDNENATASQRNKLYFNGGNAVNNNTSTSAASAATTASFDLRICARANSGDLVWLGYVSEIIIFKGDNTANRTGIRDNINTFYGVY